MGKKRRTPPPPRRAVQAPRKRAAPSGQSRTRLWLAGVAGVLVVAAAIAGIALAVGGEDEAEALISTPACTEQVFPDQGRQHSPPFEVPADFEYNSTPPTSGPHDPDPAIWDVYSSPVEEKKLIHNLEHGGIVVQYGDGVVAAQRDALLAWYVADPNGIIVAPKPDLGDRIAATAWRHLLTCTSVDEGALSAFRDAHRYEGPETGFSAEYYEPGNG